MSYDFLGDFTFVIFALPGMVILAFCMVDIFLEFTLQVKSYFDWRQSCLHNVR